ncbi:MAG: AMP-binding protein, partial [Microcoleus sp. SIO2G3]|nr:AMP-binding protein [Microcoleus sp. SIO2G3]
AKNLAKSWQRRGGKLLLGNSSNDNAPLLQEVTARRTQELQQIADSATLPIVLLTESDPIKFLAGVLATAAIGAPVVLANPRWVESDWQQVKSLIQPNLIWGESPLVPSSIAPPKDLRGSVMISTGGSSGQVRFAMHSWRSLTASVRGFQAYFGCKQIHSCCALPLHHVSGLMQFWRGYVTGGTLAIAPFKSIQAGLLPAIDPQQFFLSLVPTQLQRLLESDLTNWLRQFHTVLLGGAPAWPELLDRAQALNIRLAPTYGMTETASQVATLRPEQFLQGRRSCGSVLPHAQIRCDATGQIQIQARSLCLGYYPDRFLPNQPFTPDDLGYFDELDELQIVGRSSSKMITGGENVFPAEVEAAIRATGLVDYVCVFGMPDRNCGEVVTAAFVFARSGISLNQLQQETLDRLAPFKRPKQCIAR